MTALRKAASIVGLLVIAGMPAVVLGLRDRLWPSRQLLTITKPEGGTGAMLAPAVAASATATERLTIAPVPRGGTIEGVDILCGTRGSICSVDYPLDSRSSCTQSLIPDSCSTNSRATAHRSDGLR